LGRGVVGCRGMGWDFGGFGYTLYMLDFLIESGIQRLCLHFQLHFPVIDTNHLKRR
jgi:hypothetical protein